MSACTRNDKQADEISVTLKASGTKSLPLDSRTPNWAGDCQYYDGGRDKEVVLYYSPVTNVLHLYDLQNGNRQRSIAFENEGPGSIPEPMAVQMVATDSILVATSYTKALFLIDSTGTTQNRYTIGTTKVSGQTWESEPNGSFFVQNGRCVFQTIPSASPQDASVFYRTTLGAYLDLKSGRSVTDLMMYPKEYQTGETWTMFHTIQRITLIDSGHMVTSYPICDNVQELNMKGKLLGEHNARSLFFTEKTKALKDGVNGRDHFLRQNSYGAIYFDPYRQVFYRFAFQGIRDALPKVSGPVIPATYMSTSIIILNRNLARIGETRLPDNTHYCYNTFVGRDGLYISNSHPKNPASQENQVSFTCYKLSPQ